MSNNLFGNKPALFGANNQQNNFPEKRRENRSRSVAIKLDKIDENDANAKELKVKRREIILGKANEV